MYWLQEQKSRYGKLEQDISCEAAVIGGGLTGVTTAYYLSKAGIKTALFEAGVLGCGVSGKTTAHITVQHDLTYDRYIRRFGKDTARIVAREGAEAIRRIRSLVEENGIDCDYSPQKSYLFTNQKSGIKKLETELIAAKTLGIGAELTASADFPLKYISALAYRNQAQFHPVKYLNGLAAAAVREGTQTYENTRVLRIERGRLKTDSGADVSAEHIVVATHNPLVNSPGMFFLKEYQHRSYVGVYSGVNIDGMWTNIDSGGHTFRSHNGNVIISGEDHRTGTQTRKRHYQSLNNFAAKVFPNSRLISNYSAQDGITLDNLPYIGRYSKKTKNLYVATGFGKWGMTYSNTAARLIADLILGVENETEKVFSPCRPAVPYTIWSAARLVTAMLGGYIGGLFRPQNPTCTHLKGKCKYNSEEHSWDCPCHGSRFTAEGEVIDSPATHGLLR